MINKIEKRKIYDFALYPYSHGQPLSCVKQIRVLVSVPHKPQVSLQEPPTQLDHVPPSGQGGAGVVHSVDGRGSTGIGGYNFRFAKFNLLTCGPQTNPAGAAIAKSGAQQLARGKVHTLVLQKIDLVVFPLKK